MEARGENHSNTQERCAAQAEWPLPFRLKLPRLEQQGEAEDSPQTWWSHNLYRGPRNRKPKVLYARSKADSEKIAQDFLHEDVLGFDMEWPCYNGSSRNEDRLQDRVGLIAIACETKIALIHIGAFTGKKPKDFIGPTMQTIIESPRIRKAGVNILAADFQRLRDWFELEPQGAVELSHLHNLVTYGRSGQTSQCTTKLCALEKQVQTHLRLPLKKGRVRTSNWSQKKQLSREQKAYAASDAYAGFMLYHYLTHLRLSMEPSPPPPPPPLFAERYKWFDIPRRGTTLLLELDDSGDGRAEGALNVITAIDYFQGRHENIHSANVMSPTMPPAHDAESEGSQGPSSAHIRENTAIPPILRTSGHVIKSRQWRNKSSRKKPDTLLQKLQVHRERIAKQRHLDPWKIVHNSALKLIAELKPENEMALVEIRGVGPRTVKKYGAAILNIVAIHVAHEKHSTGAERSDEEIDHDADVFQDMLRPGDPTDSTDTVQNISHRSETTQLHTGPSLIVQEERLGSGSPSQPIIIEDPEDSSSLETSSSTTRKRKRTQTVSNRYTSSRRSLSFDAT
ncbi:hypothetical protein Daus18300_013935 [Diaporthe australafricana]|uniref:HRDC domain-containing protein n=1 Tax=Diaporthe australafricana TaxID=127596 RepID=A0ABR3VX54_9PEZI